ncbi:MAG: DNA polymerase IV [Treponemataceae bacterium]
MTNSGNATKKVILHVDLDAFYASVEQLDNPQYRGKPVVVGGLPTDKRSVVSTCSYEARAFGIHSAMPIFKAYKLCPHAIYLRGRMERYLEKSHEIMKIFYNFSPDVQQMSIDEAFIDISGTEKLFGSPEKIVERLKNEVKEKTGLTISVGLASNKYIAKIASGISKPNGFYSVPEGSEQDFMHSLPLKKIWGAGEKTVKRLQGAGLFTVCDVYSCSLHVLKKILGEAGGDFIYRAVRGLEAENFSRPAKNQSISSEQTYAQDLHDSYIIESALMQLSTEVMFRLLRENFITKTVQIKIRYSDFTSVTMQETFSRPIFTCDDFFKHIKNLFYKKWNKNSIRLLGVTAQHVQSDTSFVETELFDFENEKIKKLEKTVLELQQKNPSLTLKKARLLKKITTHKHIYSILIFFSIFFHSLFSQEVEKIVLPPLMTLPSEAPSTIFQYSKNSTEVEFFASGFWDAELSYSASVFFDEDGKASFESGIPIFMQKADFMLSILLNKTWYFETAIADDFDKSALAAGFLGDGVIRHIRLGNNGIFFPEYYSNSRYVSQNTQENSYDNISPGILGQLGGEKWNADFMLRYDNAHSQEKNFLGTNEISSNNIFPHRFENGKRFTLPSKDLFNSVKAIFVQVSDNEKVDNPFFDSSGRKYKQLTSSEFLILPMQEQIIFSKNYTGKILISFFAAKSIIETELGSFRTNAVDGSGFLGETEELFGSDLPVNQRPFLRDYTHPTAGDFFARLNQISDDFLLLQDPPYFSPFAVASKYKSSSTKLEASYVIYNTSGAVVKNYRSQILTDDSVFIQEDQTRRYPLIEIYAEEAQNSGYLLPLHRFPFAREFPLIYLQNKTPSDCDIVIQVDTYSEESRMEISQNAVPGSIRVYRNGVLDGGFDYNQVDGTIRLHSSVSPFDKIRVTWLENSTQYENGTLSLAAGYKMDITDTLAFDTSVHGQWNFSQKKYNSSGNVTPASSNIYAGIKWSDYGFNIENIVQGGIEIENTTGVYRIFEINDENIRTNYLNSKSDVIVSQDLIPSLNVDFAPSLFDTHRGSLNHDSIQDSGITGHAVLFDWDMNSVSENVSASNPAWTALNIVLSSNASDLQSAQRFDFAFKVGDGFLANDFEIYLQLGVDADEDVTYENTTAIPTWKIENFNRSETGWQTLSIEFTDAHRNRFISNSDMRIIVTQSSKGKGVFFIGPYEITGTSYNVQADAGTKTFIENRRKMADTPHLSLPNFVDDDYITTLSASWQAVSASDILFSRFIPEIPLKSYTNLHFFMHIPARVNDFNVDQLVDHDFTLIMRRQTEYGTETALQFTIPENILENMLSKNAWVPVIINLSEKSISIGGSKLSAIESNLYVDKELSPTEVIFKISPLDSTNIGKIYFSEFYLEENHPLFSVSNSLSVGWKKNGSVLKAGKFNIVSSPSIFLKGTGKGTFHDNTTKFALAGEGNASVILTGIKLAGNIYRAEGEENIITSAGHSISTAPKGFELGEIFHFSDNGNTAHKKESFRLYIPGLKNPISTAASFYAEKNGFVEKQQFKNDVTIGIPFKQNIFTVQGSLEASQQIRSNNLFTTADSSDYASSWMDLSNLQFSQGESSAVQRTTKAQIKQTLAIPSINFAPSFSVVAHTVYQISNVTMHTDRTQFILAMPFSVKRNTFSFVWTKEAGAEKRLSSQGGNYQTDAEKYFSSAAHQPWIVSAPIFYDFFYPQLSSVIQDGLLQNENLSASKLFYSSQYAFTWDRILSSLWYDLVVPNRTSINFSRNINASHVSVTDIYKAEISAYFTSFNLFGLFSPYQLFKWLEQDEVRSSHTVKLQFEEGDARPKNWSYAGNFALVLYFRDIDDYVSNSFGFEIFSNNTLRVTNTVLWSRDAKKSFLTDFFAFLFPKVSIAGLKLRRENNLKYLIQKNNDIYQEVLLNHIFTIYFNQNINMKLTAEGIFWNYYKKSSMLTTNFSIAGKVSY